MTTVDDQMPITATASVLQKRLLSTIEQEEISAKGLTTTEERFALLHASSPLFAQLRATSRRVHEDTRNGKGRVTEIRTRVDNASLALQNLKYQKRHLQEEIRNCKSFQSIYENVSLIDVDQFMQSAPEAEKTDEITTNAHKLYLARLRFELSERKRLEEEKQQLQSKRAALMKENRKKKQRLEGLESDLKEMLSRSIQVRNRFEEANREEQQPSAAEDEMQTDPEKRQRHETASSTAAATPIPDQPTPKPVTEG
ncbi:uncharacterized protein FA14DRAFT_43169 [Meira miltonrushii]|uniref:Fms interacting protein n=1 Tax=Meira miltonrushii TaxID=1280837 RepID=A0A316VD07_9BASI|nr:uncharacterized protein FA14DRAFT_43169 [Meira miltonrushii]PWN35529.1 hypothetical protein FA14DRAFT_43169 [Meira miltonrushii]